ncbi:hypothetical protein MMUR_39780 [Mycolicibacterium murale]|uniref:Uncharacterized protein n=1 Tax=Mycolicibacterium murale TaxID=182220 RepID=A0A7I9WQ39_9MYCO|nr:hypothetical protein [Mycolicibacterium murale]GFG59842.1 hypothetical protein MMUR_39780 [Mycolicibacterium murale]
MPTFCGAGVRPAVAADATRRSYPMVEYSEAGDYGYEPAGAAHVERNGCAERFECGVCRLKLDRRGYLVEAFIPLEVVPEPDAATEDEISEYEEARSTFPLAGHHSLSCLDVGGGFRSTSGVSPSSR